MDAFTCLGDFKGAGGEGDLPYRVTSMEEPKKRPDTCMTGGIILRSVGTVYGQPNSPSYCHAQPTLEDKAATAAHMQQPSTQPSTMPDTCMTGGIILGNFNRPRPFNGQPRGLSSCYEPPSREELEAASERNAGSYVISGMC